MANPIQVTIALADAADNNISTSASPGAGAILINGSAATGGVATLDTARRVLFTSGTSDAGITFTVTGTNRDGNPLVETITGGATTASTTQDFKTVSRITHTGSVAGTLKVGTSGVASSQWCAANFHTTPLNIGIGVTVTGTVSFTVEYTYDNPNAPYSGTFPTVWPISALAAKAVNTDGSIIAPIYAYRVTQNSFSSGGTIKMIGIQAGLGFGN